MFFLLIGMGFKWPPMTYKNLELENVDHKVLSWNFAMPRCHVGSPESTIFQRFGNSDTFDIRLVSIFNSRNCCTIFKAKKVAWGFIIISSNWGAIIQWFGSESSMVDLLVLMDGNGGCCDYE